MNATLIVGRVSTDLSPDELDLMCKLICDEHNRLTAQWAYQRTTEPERRQLDNLLKRLEMVRRAQSNTERRR